MRWLVSARAAWIFATGVVFVSACATAVEDDEPFVEGGTTSPSTTSDTGGTDGAGGDGVTVGSTSSTTSAAMGGFGGMGGMGPTSTVSSTTSSTSVTTVTTTTTTTGGGTCQNGVQCGATCCVDPLMLPLGYQVCCPTSPANSCGIELINNPLNIPCQCTDGC